MSAAPLAGTDAELLEATLAGNEAAFVELYRRHKDRVYRFAYRMTGSPDLAQEVTQSCFVALLEAPSLYDSRRASLGTYLCAAARNQSLRHASRTWRERPLAIDSERQPSLAPSPEQDLLAQERAELVREAILALPPLHREVLILAEYEELGMGAIAQIVGAETGAVKVRLHRARQKLRAALETRVRARALLAK